LYQLLTLKVGWRLTYCVVGSLRKHIHTRAHLHDTCVSYRVAWKRASCFAQEHTVYNHVRVYVHARVDVIPERQRNRWNKRAGVDMCSVYQARNQLGTPAGAKRFLRGAQNL